MIKLIVSDLDGTLLDEGQKVRPTDQEALRRAADQGVEICLASGRMQEEFTHVMDQTGLTCHGVSQNGSFVHTKDNELLHQQTFSLEMARDIYDTTKAFDLFLMICFEHQLVTPQEHAFSKLIRNRLFAPIDIMSDVRERFSNEWLPCKFSYFGELTVLKELKATLENNARLAPHIDAFISDKDCLDVMPVGVSKGTGLKALVQHLGIQPDEVLCVGDAFNDVSMFEAFPSYSCAMAHSPEGVRTKARYTVGSVAEAVEKGLKG
jgi:Cof subfamily protein (haloacid dehalogenase superfamily)